MKRNSKLDQHDQAPPGTAHGPGSGHAGAVSAARRGRGHRPVRSADARATSGDAERAHPPRQHGELEHAVHQRNCGAGRDDGRPAGQRRRHREVPGRPDAVHGDRQPNNNTDGGYVRAAVRDLDDDNKTKFMTLLNSLHIKSATSRTAARPVMTMMEAYYYFAGQNPRSGNNKVKTDYTATPSAPRPSNAIYALPENALPQRDGTVPPVRRTTARSSTAAAARTSSSTSATARRRTTTPTTPRRGMDCRPKAATPRTIPISPSGSMSNMADEWSRFMEVSPYGITTYTVDVDKVTTGQGPGWTALLKSMANVSRGKYFDVSSGGGGSEIRTALQTIFSEIQAVNTVFASVSLPVSVNTEGTYLNQIYIGMFRPDRDALPRWVGNLKQYKLGLGNGRLQTQDANSVSAINSSTGFITECARSFWTPTTVDSYWAFRPQGACLAVAGSTELELSGRQRRREGCAGLQVAGADDRAQPRSRPARLRPAPRAGRFRQHERLAGRPGCCQHDGARSAHQLGAWAGLDDRRRRQRRDENVNGVTASDTPPSAALVPRRRRALAPGGRQHGHATPRPRSWCSTAATTACCAPSTATAEPTAQPIAGIAAGDEMWAFMAPEFYPHIKRLRDNTDADRFLRQHLHLAPGPSPTASTGR